ncbi:MAG: alkene reductase [Verrucomicrobiales bacterium]|nr:alkene reductase [Verrucomicrobiales bacterium]
MQPLHWENLELNNRVVMAPMTRGRAIHNIPNALMAEYYTQRSSAGLIISEGTFISKEAIGWHNAPGIWSEEQQNGWEKVTERVHSRGTPIICQLWHTGRASHSDFLNGKLPVSASAVRHEGDKVTVPSGEEKEHETPRALDSNELPRVVSDYRDAAIRAKAAGFDGVEIHAANGYLLDQFLQSKTNHRSDAYGGSLENRYRLLREVIEACAGVYPLAQIGVRISPNGSFNDMGSEDFRETFLFVAEQLSSFDLAYLHVLDGLAFGFHELGDPITLSEIREVYSGRLMGNCGYDSDEADQRISDDDADLISFGRPFISNPDLVERFANGWEFNPQGSQETWYTPGAEGYTDFPVFKDADSSEMELEESAR